MTRNVKKTSTVKRILKKKKNTAVGIKRAKKRYQDVKSIRYQDYLIKTLQDPKEAAGYLNTALSGGDIKVFLLALQNVVQAQGGIAVLSEKTHRSRTSLYKSLSENGNPYLKSANDLLTAMGMHLAVVPNNQRIPMSQRN